MNVRSSHTGAAGAPGRGEFAFERDDFLRIAGLLHESCGIHLPENKSALVYSRLVKRIRSLGLSSFRDYCNLISGPGGAPEFANMRDALTTNVTRFFREPHHFDHLRTKLLPDLMRAARSGRRVRIWSAGCSTGQEPYSIALTILSQMPDARGHDLRILATDISEAVLRTARLARYSAEEIRDIPAEMRNRWMEKAGDSYEFDAAVKGMVTVKPLNLVEPWPMKGPFDAIFCRNVVIYFEEPTQQDIWRRMVPLLSPKGALYIGHSERVTGVSQNALSAEGTTTYALQGRSAA